MTLTEDMEDDPFINWIGKPQRYSRRLKRRFRNIDFFTSRSKKEFFYLGMH